MAADSPFDILDDSFFTGVQPPPPGLQNPLARLLSAFPFKEVRPVQQRSLAVVADSIESGKSNTILEIPTGGGKSPISMAVGIYAGEAKVNPGAHILTSQNNLLNQMMNDFSSSGLVDIRGKGNYRCETHHSDCNIGTLANGGQVCLRCPYRDAKNTFISSPLGVTNYTYYLTESRFVREIEPRNFLILDEAHNIEDEVLGTVHIDVTEKVAQELQISLPHFDPDSQDEARTWLSKVFIPAADKRDTELRRRIAVTDVETGAETDEGLKKKSSNLSQELRKKLSALANLVTNVQNYLGDTARSNWLAWTGDKGSLVIRPLSAADYAQEMLFSRSPNVLMMSATLLDFKTFQNNLGLDMSDTNVFAAPSDFPKANRRIVYWPSGSMGYKDIEATLPRIASRTEALIEKYAAHKGIIHSHSYKINAYLENYFSNTKHRHRIITHTSRPGEREAAIAAHISSEDPTILLSPSMTEGLDLKDGLSRFQVITKVPYPFLDPYTRARLERDELWYQLKTALALVQATGRSVRSAEDWAITVILDSAFERFLIKNQDILPEWWKDAIEFK